MPPSGGEFFKGQMKSGKRRQPCFILQQINSKSRGAFFGLAKGLTVKYANLGQGPAVSKLCGQGLFVFGAPLGRSAWGPSS